MGLRVREWAAVTLYPGDTLEYLEAKGATLRPFTCSLPPTRGPALGETLLEETLSDTEMPATREGSHSPASPAPPPPTCLFHE